MFASLSSFLPSVLQPSLGQPKSLTVNVVHDDREVDNNNDTDDAKSDTMTADDPAVAGRKKDKRPSETFIFVRPPPSKSNHPLNLQVQMVPPRPSNNPPNTAGSVSSRQSIDYSATLTPTPTANYPGAPTSANTITHPRSTSDSNDTSNLNLALTRSNSNRSETSTYSASTSVASFSSVASTASASSASSTRRAIIPLYNLQAHNVMTNTIVDAGTDAKIAKFNKRGMELIGLAILEPVEVWPATTTATGTSPLPSFTYRDSLLHPGTGADLSPFLHPKRLSTASRPTTPDMPHTPASSSALSLSSASHSHAHSPTHPYPAVLSAAIEEPPPARNKRDIFGKLFKKKDAALEPSAALLPPAPPAPPQSHQHLRLHATTHERTLSISNVASNATSRVTRHFKRASLSTSITTTSSPIIPVPVPPSNQLPASLLFDVKPHIVNMSTIERFNGADSNINPASPTVGGITSHSNNSNNNTASTAAAAAAGSASTLLRPPVLGIQPTLSSPVIPPVGRPTLYVWVVRRWLKGADNGILGGVMGKLGVGGGGGGGGGGGASGGGSKGMLGVGGGGVDSVEVSFEWKRGRSDKRRKRRKRGVRIASGDMDRERGGLETGSRRASVVGSISASNVSTTSSRGGSPLREAQVLAHQQVQAQQKERLRGHRMSIASQRSGASAVSEDRGSRRGNGGGGRGGDEDVDGNGNGDEDGGEDGEDSDPEDSETPWTCTLKVRRVAAATASPYSDLASGAGAGAGPGTSTGGEELVLRVKVGTLSQTPHHPKVVAMLKVPFPLPDVAVEVLAVRRRVVVMQGGVMVVRGDGAGSGSGDGLILTAEEIKDVVSSTGLWLVVREGLGGVGKVSRKGDGWRIRA